MRAVSAASTIPEAPSADGQNEYDEYVSDPKKPVPYIPGHASGMATRYMVDDQRFAARRPDVNSLNAKDGARRHAATAGPRGVSLLLP